MLARSSLPACGVPAHDGSVRKTMSCRSSASRNNLRVASKVVICVCTRNHVAMCEPATVRTWLPRWYHRPKSKTASLFVTLPPPRGRPTVHGGQRGGGSPPRGVRGASATTTKGAGPGAGINPHPKMQVVRSASAVTTHVES